MTWRRWMATVRQPPAVLRRPRSPIEYAGMIVLGSEAHGLSHQDLKLVTDPGQRRGRVTQRSRRGGVDPFRIRRRRRGVSDASALTSAP